MGSLQSGASEVSCSQVQVGKLQSGASGKLQSDT